MGYLTNDAPEAPNYAAANEAAVRAQIDTLPTQRTVDAAARAGTEAYKIGYERRRVDGSTPEQIAAAREQASALGAKIEDMRKALESIPQSTERIISTDPKSVNFNKTETVPNPEYQQMQQAIANEQQNLDQFNTVINKGESYEAYFDPEGNEVSRNDALLGDFTGIGDADIAAINSDKMAQAMLDLQRKYGEDFVAEARKQLELSDPEGFAARKELYDQITGQLGEERDTSLAQTLEAQIRADLEAGGNLDDQTRREVEQSVRRGQAARGNMMGNAAQFQESMEVGNAAEARRNQRQQKALGFLTSGASADDVRYRQNQQNLANLGAFLSGSTPTAQFGQLSGAQQGAAPFQAGAPAANIAPNTAAMAFNNANTYNTNFTNWWTQQENPWVTGINLGSQAIGNIAGGAMMCWLAREVFGTETDKWKCFRFWLMTKAPASLRAAYIAHAEGLAAMVRHNPMAKELIRVWMNHKLEAAYG